MRSDEVTGALRSSTDLDRVVRALPAERDGGQELKRRTHVVRIFPHAASCLRLVRALAVETHEGWLEAPR